MKKNEIVFHPLTIEKSPYRIGRNMQALKELIRIIREEKIDIVHCHNPMGGVLGRLAAHLSGREVHVIYTAHGFHFYKGAPLKKLASVLSGGKIFGEIYGYADYN